MYNGNMVSHEPYRTLVDALLDHFGDRLQAVVLFGSRSRDDARPESDHDIFVVIEGLPDNPLWRQREVRMALLDYLDEMPEGISILAKTPEEVDKDLTPLLVDVFMEGKPIWGESYFQERHAKVARAVHEAGLVRRRIGGTWMWVFPSPRWHGWELTWEGYRELAKRS